MPEISETNARAILLVEDDPLLGRGLSVNLESEGFQVRWVRDLASAFRSYTARDVVLIVLDLGLPDGDGFDLLRKLRDTGSTLPVVVCTAQTDQDKVVEALQLGARDYVRKPFGGKELIARIRAALGELHKTGPQLRYGELVILPDQRKVLFRDQEIELYRREYEVLAFLVQRAEAVVSRDSLLEHIERQVTDKEEGIYDRTVDSHISHVRGRLRAAGVHSIQISSVYGVGYRLERR